MENSIADWADQVQRDVARLRPLGDHVVFVSGNFNIVHPGHLRLLNFAAECGEFLVVGVYEDGLATSLLPQDLRLAGVQSIGVVDYAFLLPEPPDGIIRRLQPHFVVKGKEHETSYNIEQDAVDSYEGTLLFSSGETRLSASDLLHHEYYSTSHLTIVKPVDYMKRHNFTFSDLIKTVEMFTDLNVLVIGDLIIDEYVACDALGMSQEDPTLVVTPVRQERYIGGAGIVAAHAAGLGAHVKYLSVVGTDVAGAGAVEMLLKSNVDVELLRDASRPTTVKQRYRVGDKTLLRVSHLRQHDISSDLIDDLHKKTCAALDHVDLVIFSDFNYGVLPQYLVDLISAACRQKGIMMVADSQASSQIGDVSRFKDMLLLTPTEREARLAMRDTRSGLVVLADALYRKSNPAHIVMTMGADGLLIHAPQDRGAFLTDQLPAFNTAPRDVSGAGDSLLTCTSMALAVGGDIWLSAYLGSVAAACQVARVGNVPLTAAQIIAEIKR